MKSITTYHKWGNSFGIHISEDILKAMELLDSDEIIVSLPTKLSRYNKNITFMYGKAEHGEIRDEVVLYKTRVSTRGYKNFMIIPAAFRKMYQDKDRLELILLPTAKPRLIII